MRPPLPHPHDCYGGHPRYWLHALPTLHLSLVYPSPTRTLHHPLFQYERKGKHDCERGWWNNRRQEGCSRGVVKVGLQRACECYAGDESRRVGKRRLAWMMNTIPSLRSPPTGDTSVLQHPSLRQFCFHSLTKEWISSTQQKKSFKKLQGWEREKIGNKENWNERERKKERKGKGNILHDKRCSGARTGTMQGNAWSFSITTNTLDMALWKGKRWNNRWACFTAYNYCYSNNSKGYQSSVHLLQKAICLKKYQSCNVAFVPRKCRVQYYISDRGKIDDLFEIQGSVYRRFGRNTNKMQLCNRIY